MRWMGFSTWRFLREATFSASRCLIEHVYLGAALSGYVRHKTLRLHFETIYRSRGRDVQGAIVLVSPGQVCRLFRQHNRSEVIAFGIPNPNAFGSSDE